MHDSIYMMYVGQANLEREEGGGDQSLEEREKQEVIV